MDKKIIGFVPCKIESKRLSMKNLQFLHGKMLIETAIDYLLSSRYIDIVYVSTEAAKADWLQDLLGHYGDSVKVVRRSGNLDNNPEAWMIDVYYDFFKMEMPEFDIMVTTNADAPLKPLNLDGIIERFVEYGSWEFFTTNPDTGLRSGALNIYTRNVIEKRLTSQLTMSLPLELIDIHTATDLKDASDKLAFLYSKSIRQRDYENGMKRTAQDQEKYGSSAL